MREMKATFTYERPDMDKAYAFTRCVAEHMGSPYRDPAWVPAVKKFLERSFMPLYSGGVTVHVHYGNPQMEVRLEAKVILHESNGVGPNGRLLEATSLDPYTVKDFIERTARELGIAVA